jgi:hypothetical protein
MLSEVPELLLEPRDAQIVTSEPKEYLSFGIRLEDTERLQQLHFVEEMSKFFL